MEVIAKAIQSALTFGKHHILIGRGESLYLTSQKIIPLKTFHCMDHVLEHDVKANLKLGKPVFSFHNGMGHTDDDFIKLVQKISTVAPPHHLLINIYNPSVGTFSDAKYVALQKMNFSTEKVEKFSKLIPKMLQYTSSFHPESRLIHIAHSEAGIICDNALKSLSPDNLELVKRHMDVITIGSPRPVSRALTRTAVNFYSENDYLVIPFVKVFQNDENYQYQALKSMSQSDQKHLQFIDHAMTADTYFDVITRILKSDLSL